MFNYKSFKDEILSQLLQSKVRFKFKCPDIPFLNLVFLHCTNQ